MEEIKYRNGAIKRHLYTPDANNQDTSPEVTNKSVKITYTGYTLWENHVE